MEDDPGTASSTTQPPTVSAERAEGGREGAKELDAGSASSADQDVTETSATSDSGDSNADGAREEAVGHRVEVQIFGSTYNVRGQNDPDSLRFLAEKVDRKMREIAVHLKTVDTAKIAVLAALNLADELARLESDSSASQADRGLSEKASELAGRLEAALGDAG